VLFHFTFADKNMDDEIVSHKNPDKHIKGIEE